MRSASRRTKWPSKLRNTVAIASFLLLSVSMAAIGAEYQGHKVDGIRFGGVARSLKTGKYYPASIVFERDHVKVNLESGKTVDLTLDNQVFVDPEEVVASDPLGGWWALSIDGLDEASKRCLPIARATIAKPNLMIEVL